MTLFRRVVRSAMAAAVAVAPAGVPVGSVPDFGALTDSIRGREWHLSSLDIVRAHDITEGGGVTVAVIDTGVFAGHPDLAGAVLAGKDVVPGSTADGRSDPDGHGTEMAGIIAARGHGSHDGVLGIAPEATILPIRTSVGSFGTATTIAAAVDYAIAQHVGVINMSFGSSDDRTLHDAIKRAQAADIVVVAAAGNGAEDGQEYPGKYPEVLAVGACGRDGKVASFSTVGPQVDLVAPGVDIVTTGNRGDGDYYKGDGTSEATAIVSGAAALLRSKYPDLPATEIVHRLTATATDAGAKGRDDSYGYGRLDIVKALTADVQPLPAPTVPAASAQGQTQAVDLPEANDPAILLAAGGAGAVVLVLIGTAITVGVRRRKLRAGDAGRWP